MSSIQLPGLATGMDTKALVQQLMQVESRRLSAYEKKLQGHKEKKSVFGQLQGKLSSLKSSLRALSDSSQLRSFEATSSDTDVLTVKASASAYEGNHTVQIKQLATADRWVHSGYKYETSSVGAGTFIVSYNNQQLVIQTTAQTTLQDLVTLINNDPDNPGINAGILKYEDGSGNNFHLVLSGKSSGSDYQITVDASSAEVRTAASTLTVGSDNASLSSKLIDLEDFSGQSPAVNFANLTQVTIRGDRHDGTDVSSVFTINANSTVEDLIGEIESAFGDSVKVAFEDGLLKVTDKTTGASQMTLELDFQAGAQTATMTTSQTVVGGAQVANIAALAGANFTETQSAQDSLIKVDGYPLPAEQWISRSSNTIDDVISGVTLNLQDDTSNGTGYDSISVNLTRDTEKLKENLKSMVEAYNTVVMYFDEQTKYDEEAKKSGLLSAEYSLTSIRSLLKLPVLTNAVGFTSTDSFDNASDIGLSFDADGMLELDESEFDEAVVDDYLGVLSLLGATKTGSTSGADAAYLKYYGSSKNTTAGIFNVRVNANGTALIKLSTETWDQARAATVTGNYIYGNSTMDSRGKPRYPEFDLQLSLDPTQLGRQMDVTLNIRQGVAGDLYDELDAVLKSKTGRMSLSVDSVDKKIESMEDQIEKEEIRLTAVEARLVARYARLERTLSMIQQQFSGLGAL